MQNTINYGLKKPESTDYIDINDFNENADIIDTQLKENADGLTSLEKTAATKEEVQTLSETVAETDSKLDAAATKQAEILTSVNDVKTDTTAIKSNTTKILSNLPSNGSDWSQYTSYGYKLPSSNYNANLTSRLSINGRGYMSYINIYVGRASPLVANETLQLQLILDDVTVFDFTVDCGDNTGTSYYTRLLFDSDNISGVNTSSVSFSDFNYPILSTVTKNSLVKNIYFAKPLFFENKFEIKVKGTISTCNLKGGLA